MFDLETAITEWRHKMLAAGIQSPVPLEELEGHLREEIGERVKAGVVESEAFHIAVAHIGEAGLVRTEFARAVGILGWLGNDPATRIRRGLGIIWIGRSLWSSWNFLNYFVFISHVHLRNVPVFTIAIDVGFDLGMVVGGVCLVIGLKVGRKIIKFGSWLSLITVILEVLAITIWHPPHFPPMAFTFYLWGAFSLITIWLLRAPRKTALAVN